jgi:sugar phosphate isomerase/epimerase
MRERFAEIGRDSVGLVLDSWHWYTAGETAEDLRGLTNQDVVACDLKDAPKSVPIDQQRDGARELACATGG